MGKVSFPLINVRKDVVSRWHMKHYMADNEETIVVPEVANEYGYYTAFLTEVPDAGSSSKTISSTPPKISGLVEFRGTPVHEKTLRLLLEPNQFFVNYQTGEILFHPAQAGKTFTVDYWGKGSLVEADDVNYIHRKMLELQNEHKDLPEITCFRLDNLNTILEVGQGFPSSTSPSAAVFLWEISSPEQIKEDSIKITMTVGSTEKILRNGLENTGEFTYDFPENLIFINPQKIKFKISAVVKEKDLVLEKELDVIWTDRIFWGISFHKDNITADQIKNTFTGTTLFDNIESEQYQKLKFIEAPDNYKVIVTSKRYPLQKVIDPGTSLEFIMNSAVGISITNNYGLEIPYLVYTSAYPVTSALELIAKMGVPTNEN